MSSMRFPSREEVEKVRNEYPKGCRVVLERMDDMQACLLYTSRSYAWAK